MEQRQVSKEILEREYEDEKYSKSRSAQDFIELPKLKHNLELAQDPETYKRMRGILAKRYLDDVKENGNELDKRIAQNVIESMKTSKDGRLDLYEYESLKKYVLKNAPEMLVFVSKDNSVPWQFKASQRQINSIPNQGRVLFADIFGRNTSAFVINNTTDIFQSLIANIGTMVHEGEHTGQRTNVFNRILNANEGYTDFYGAIEKFKQENKEEFDKVFTAGNAMQDSPEMFANLVEYEASLPQGKSLFDTPVGKYLKKNVPDAEKKYYSSTMANVPKVHPYQTITDVTSQGKYFDNPYSKALDPKRSLFEILGQKLNGLLKGE